MWQRLSMLALCGMSALCADVCDGLPTGPPKGFKRSSTTYPFADLAQPPPPLSFRLSVKRGGPASRIPVRPFCRLNAKGSVVNDNAGDIEVARCQDGKRLQLLPIMAWQPLDFGHTFDADDINF